MTFFMCLRCSRCASEKRTTVTESRIAVMVHVSCLGKRTFAQDACDGSPDAPMEPVREGWQRCHCSVLVHERDRGIATFFWILAPHFMRRANKNYALRMWQQTLELSVDHIGELKAALAAKQERGASIRLTAANGKGGNASRDMVRAFHSAAFSRRTFRTSGGSVVKVIF